MKKHFRTKSGIATVFAKFFVAFLFFALAFVNKGWGQVTVTGADATTNAGSPYSTLQAAFAAINGQSQAGNTITISITANTSEVSSAVLNAGAWTSLTISPSGGASRTISGSIAGHLIDLNGADNVTIDGLNSGGNALIISNTATGATSTIRFILDATNNLVTRCTLSGSSTSFGVVYFATAAAGGNDNNTISFCDIGAAGSNNPINGITSQGTSGQENSGNTINSNNIFDYFSASGITRGLDINTNSTAWTITNNKFYQTATRLYTTGNPHSVIQIQTGSGYTITGNIIGFANSSGTGTTNMVGNSVTVTGFPTSYTSTGTATTTRLVAINCAFTAGGTVSEIQNNTIAGICLYTSSGAGTTTGVLCGIAVTSGNANIGTTTGNTIGVSSGSNSLYIAASNAGAVVSPIYCTTSNTITIQNNTIGGIDCSGRTASTAAGFKGIEIAGAGTYTVSNNTIGNATANNIRTGYLLTGGNLSNTATTPTTATGASVVQGIVSAATGGTISITNNTIRGIQISGSVTTFNGISNSGAFTTSLTIDNNLLGTASTDFVTYAFANSGTLNGITSTAGGSSASLSIQSNNIRGIVHSASGTNAHNYIFNSGATLSQNISSNNFTNLSVATSGSVTFISNSVTVTATGTQSVSSNAIVTAYAKTVAGGTVTLFTSNASSASGAAITQNNNNFSNITLTGATTMAGWVNTDGGTPTKTINSNTFTNWTCGSNAVTVMNINFFGGTSTINSNTINSITGTLTITGISIGGSGTATSVTLQGNTINNLSSTGTGGNVTGISTASPSTITTHNINGNTIHTLSSTATSAAVVGISSGTSATTANIFKNKIYGLSASGTTPLVSGVIISASGTTTNVYNNFVGSFSATSASNGTTDVVRGINITSTSTSASINVSYNTVYLTGSGGANFTTSALFHTISTTATTSALTLRNNILYNISTPSGTGLTIAYRRSAGAASNLANYGSSSNNNLFYAGTPSATNLIYSDGTSTAQTISAYKSGVFTAVQLPQEIMHPYLKIYLLFS